MTRWTGVALGAAILLSTIIAAAQPGHAPCTAAGHFDIISIHPSPPGTTTENLNGNDGRMTGQGVTLLFLIQSALDVRSFQVEGLPGRAAQGRYDFTAKVDDPDGEAHWKECSDAEQARRYRERLTDLLTTRFGLHYTAETRTRPGFLLEVDSSGSKLQESADEGGYLRRHGEAGFSQMDCKAARMDAFAQQLSNVVERTVVDRTGLFARYTFTLRWSPDGAESPEVPSLFTALREQLGLRLERASVPTKIYTIERLTPPTGN